MTDMHGRFRSLDRIPAPDLWVDIEDRAMAFDSSAYAVVGVRRSTASTQRARRPRVVLLVAAALALVLLAATAVLIGSLLGDGPRTLPLVGTFTRVGPMALQRIGEDILAVGLADGRVLVLGGQTGGNDQRDIRKAEIFDPATGKFTATGTLHEAHGQLTSTTLLADGRVLIAGGWHPTGAGVASVGAEIYDPGTGEFTATGEMVMPRYGHTATLLDDGRVLIAGGDVTISGHDSKRPPAELFDPESGTFSAIGPLAVDRLYHSATRLIDGRVLLAGGSLAQRDAEIFDPSTETFARVGDLAHGRSTHTATLLADGRVLIAGGNGDERRRDASLSSAELFDPATATFAETGALTTRRAGHDAARLRDGRVFVIGGYNYDGSPRGTEIYDPSTGRFVLGALDGWVGGRRSVALPDGNVLAVGGSLAGGYGEVGPATAELFDPTGASSVTIPGSQPPSSSPFQPVGAEIGERFGQSTTLLADGRVLIAGGHELDWSDPYGRPLASALIYDPRTGTISETGPLNTPRAHHAAALLADGRVLIAGGDGPGKTTSDPNDLYDPLTSVEIYDPKTGTFVTAAPLHVERGPSYGAGSDPVRPLALTVGDGRVLIVGGVVGTYGPQDVALEIYDPTTQTSETLPRHCQAGAYWGGAGQVLDDGRALIECGEAAVIFDPETDKVTQASAVAWQDGWGIQVGETVVLTAGGNGPVNGVHPSTGRVYRDDPDTGRPPLTEELGGSTAFVQAVVRLRDGRVLIVGRARNEATRGLAMMVDPVTGDMTRLEPLAARQAPLVTVLQDGRVLITGRGYAAPDEFQPRPPAAEILDPSRIP